MADIFSKKKRSQVMAAIRSTHNRSTEIKLATILRTNKISGWRRHLQIVGRPDFVFKKENVVVFVDGCFWHGCPSHGRNPDSNQDYWITKLARNKRRDRNNARMLKKRGWRVVRFWQHDLEFESRVVTRLLTALGRA